MRVLTVRNLTPHPIKLLTPDKRGELAGWTRGRNGAFHAGRFSVLTVFESDGVARAQETVVSEGYLQLDAASIPLVVTRLGAPIGLPDPRDDTWLIVSAPTAAAAKAAGWLRSDLLVVSDPVWDEHASIIGCTCLSLLL